MASGVRFEYEKGCDEDKGFLLHRPVDLDAGSDQGSHVHFGHMTANS